MNTQNAEQELDAMIVTEQGETRGQLREAMEAVQNPTNWKLPWGAAVHHSMVGRVLRAVEFFHADRATIHGVQGLTGLVIMSDRGYQG